MEIQLDNSTRYKKIQKIGEGTYGSVVLVLDHQINKTIAVKKIKVTQESQGIPINALRQISALKTFNHPNIIRFLSANYNHQQKKMYISLQFVNQTLYNHYLKGILSPYSIKSYIYQILKGLQYLELRGFMHRDLKPQNIMVTQKGLIKLIDFGQIKYFNYPSQKNQHTTTVSTLWYKAPELVLGAEQYNQKIDVWALGCIFSQLVMRRPLFQSRSQIDHIFKIFKTLGTPKTDSFPDVKNWKHMSPSFPKFQKMKLQIKDLCDDGYDLLIKMLQINPSQRITVSRALRHPYFQGVD